jgi:O-antigen ligase
MSASPQSLDARIPSVSLSHPAALAQDYGRTHDALGHQIHTVLAMVFLFLLPLATAPKDILLAVLAAWTAVRLPHIWRSFRWVIFTPIALTLIAWSLWMLISLTWSLDAKQGFDEFGALRMLLVPLLLWPVLDRLPWLIGAAIAGVLAQNIAQLLQGMEWLNLRPQDRGDRFAGWIHPIKTGAWCVTAMCWLLSASLHGKGRARYVSMALLAVTTAGLIGTASRGAWLAGAVALPAMLIVLAIRRPKVRKMAITLAIAGTAAGAAAWPFVGDGIVDRINAAIKESNRAKTKGIYWSSVGARVGMTKWSLDMFREHPIIGLGAGSYSKAQDAHPDHQLAMQRVETASQAGYMTKDHPHSLYLYALACTGAIGAAIIVMLIVVALRQAWRDRLDHLFADGMLFAMVTWFIGAQFDCYNLDGSRLGLLGALLAFTLPHRAAIRCQLSAREQRIPERTTA